MGLRQTITPDRTLGRVNASIGFIGLTATVAASLAAGAAAELIGMRWTLAAGAFSLMLGGLWLAASSMRKIRQLPSTPVQLTTVVE